MPDRVSIKLNGVSLVGDLSGALYWPMRRLLAVADTHFEKGSSLATQGRLLPPYDTRTTLERLAEAMRTYRPTQVFCLGDSFHDPAAGHRLAKADGTRLRRLAEGVDWLWICGNHDPAPPLDFGGRIESEMTVGALVFRHEARPDAAAGEISGHFHPKFGLSVRGRHVGGRCFATDGRRLILPAFGAYAGGLDLREPPLAALFSSGLQAHVIGRDRLHSFALAGRSRALRRTA